MRIFKKVGKLLDKVRIYCQKIISAIFISFVRIIAAICNTGYDVKRWLPEITMYKIILAVQFETRLEYKKANQLFNSAELILCPRGYFKNNVIVFPEEALPYFINSGLEFVIIRKFEYKGNDLLLVN